MSVYENIFRFLNLAAACISCCCSVCVCLFCFDHFNNVDNDEETMMMMAMTCVRRRQISDLPHLKIVCEQ